VPWLRLLVCPASVTSMPLSGNTGLEHIISRNISRGINKQQQRVKSPRLPRGPSDHFGEAKTGYCPSTGVIGDG
jgi:hypothetical protein